VASLQEDLDAIRAQTTVFEEAIRAWDLDAAAATLSENVVVMVPNQNSITGRQAWVEWAEAFGITEMTRYAITIDEVEVQGDLGFVRSRYEEAFLMEGVEELYSDQGKGVQIWKKESDGVWRVAIDCWNSSLPLPPGEGTD
jgi:uncharacterized protein (TIGR02246 family)